MRTLLEQIDVAKRMIAKHPRDLRHATSVADIWRVMASGQIASLMGIEGVHTIVNLLGALGIYYDLGVRYATPPHFTGHDKVNQAALAPEPRGERPVSLLAPLALVG